MEQWTAPTPAERAEMNRAEAAFRQSRVADSGRNLPRLVLHAHVTARSEDNFFTGLTENISEGGVFVSTFSPPGVGEVIRLNLSVDDEDGFVVEGEVRWHRYDDDGEVTGCGVQFYGLDPEQTRRIRQLMLAVPREPLLSDF